jgi:hypothetical protein
MANESASLITQSRLQRPVGRARDHVRGGNTSSGVISVVVYGDYLCPYCRRLRLVIAWLRLPRPARAFHRFRHRDRIAPCRGRDQLLIFHMVAADAVGIGGLAVPHARSLAAFETANRSARGLIEEAGPMFAEAAFAAAQMAAARRRLRFPWRGPCGEATLEFWP